MDDATKCIIFEAVEGDMLNYYKMLRAKMEAFNGRSNKIGESFGKWTVEFEKAYENVPKPKTHMDLFVEMSKAIDAYYLSNNWKPLKQVKSYIKYLDAFYIMYMWAMSILRMLVRVWGNMCVLKYM